MATLYLATADGPSGFSKPCVVKRIRPQFSEANEFRHMLGQEARVAALLSHPHIVQVFDFGEVDGESYLTMEYVEGASLHQITGYLKREGRKVEVTSTFAVGLAIADALEYIHNGVVLDGSKTQFVHRDVSPSNILVSAAGAIKLTDFGIVKPTHRPGRTEPGVVKGKYGYMSPEQLKGGTLDGRSDIFSLGIVLMELFTGRPLFKRGDVATTITAVLGARIPRVGEADPTLPAGLDEILQRALARRPEERYATARQLHDDLAALAKGLELGPSTRELSVLAGRIASGAPAEPSERPSFERPSEVPLTRAATPAPSYITDASGRAMLVDDIEDGGWAVTLWVALVTAVLVASLIIWFLVLR